MTSNSRASLALLAAVLLSATGVAHSQQTTQNTRRAPGSGTPSQPMTSVADIRERAARISQYRDLLKDKDLSVRQAAFIEMASSPDPAMQEVAFEAAFASSEMSMRALALRTRITRLPVFNFDIEEVIADADTLKQLMPSTVVYRAAGADIEHGVLLFGDAPLRDPKDAAGTLSATGLEVTLAMRVADPRCWGRLRLDESGALVGTLNCNPPRNGSVVTVKVKSRLY